MPRIWRLYRQMWDKAEPYRLTGVAAGFSLRHLTSTQSGASAPARNYRRNNSIPTPTGSLTAPATVAPRFGGD